MQRLWTNPSNSTNYINFNYSGYTQNNLTEQILSALNLEEEDESALTGIPQIFTKYFQTLFNLPNLSRKINTHLTQKEVREFTPSLDSLYERYMNVNSHNTNLIQSPITIFNITKNFHTFEQRFRGIKAKFKYAITVGNTPLYIAFSEKHTKCFIFTYLNGATVRVITAHIPRIIAELGYIINYNNTKLNNIIKYLVQDEFNPEILTDIATQMYKELKFNPDTLIQLMGDLITKAKQTEENTLETEILNTQQRINQKKEEMLELYKKEDKIQQKLFYMQNNPIVLDDSEKMLLSTIPGLTLVTRGNGLIRFVFNSPLTQFDVESAKMLLNSQRNTNWQEPLCKTFLEKVCVEQTHTTTLMFCFPITINNFSMANSDYWTSYTNHPTELIHPHINQRLRCFGGHENLLYDALHKYDIISTLLIVSAAGQQISLADNAAMSHLYPQITQKAPHIMLTEKATGEVTSLFKLTFPSADEAEEVRTNQPRRRNTTTHFNL